MKVSQSMNRLVIIGNGFDIAHGLKTSYKNFIDWYWKQRILGLCSELSRVSKDTLCTLSLKCEESWSVVAYVQSYFQSYSDEDFIAFKDKIENDEEHFSVTKSLLFNRISQSIETKGWVDIERDYYELLKENADNMEQCKKLNEQMDFLKLELAEYLQTQKTQHSHNGIYDALRMNIEFDIDDIAESSRKKIEGITPIVESLPPNENRKNGNTRKSIEIDETMLLDFNYTNTSHQYYGNIPVNHIHGSIDNPEQMIFGYGDEMDKDFQGLIDRNENELLKNAKSVKYLETSHYRDFLRFINGSPFHVYIMGHSCGNSDRTLLNTIFEHENCVSIKPFCYINNKGEDNYSELIMNIYRNFTDKKLFRDRVVNKERCTTLDGKSLHPVSKR